MKRSFAVSLNEIYTMETLIWRFCVEIFSKVELWQSAH